jgi:hypothetical protein
MLCVPFVSHGIDDKSSGGVFGSHKFSNIHHLNLWIFGNLYNAGSRRVLVLQV